MWRATLTLVQRSDIAIISIHALRVESDNICGYIPYLFIEFQSTLSVWRATKSRKDVIAEKTISIHALRVESDSAALAKCFIGKISIHALRVESDGKYIQ